jgi:hypothetical protein
MIDSRRSIVECATSLQKHARSDSRDARDVVKNFISEQPYVVIEKETATVPSSDHEVQVLVNVPELASETLAGMKIVCHRLLCPGQREAESRELSVVQDASDGVVVIPHRMPVTVDVQRPVSSLAHRSYPARLSSQRGAKASTRSSSELRLQRTQKPCFAFKLRGLFRSASWYWNQAALRSICAITASEGIAANLFCDGVMKSLLPYE